MIFIDILMGRIRTKILALFRPESSKIPFIWIYWNVWSAIYESVTVHKDMDSHES